MTAWWVTVLTNSTDLTQDDRLRLLSVAEDTIAYGLEAGRYRPVEQNDYRIRLGEYRASFVTLFLHGQLRGCIGTTEATQSLIDAAAYFAHAAAFSDPRFSPLTKEEYTNVDISLSILTPAVDFPFTDENDLVNQLRPGIDGLIIEKNGRRATFLPVVWESISNPQQFVNELKRKAGIAPHEAPEKAWRYTAQYYS